jgi:2-keto-4-pentenoate hydratase/2-oxohepta-3-ene-1,7-dioic acid hydratase in catechol pathway
MLFARFRHRDSVSYGIVEGGRVTPIDGGLFGDHKHAGESLDLADVQLAAPLIPPKVLAAAVNYPSHVATAKAIVDKDEAPSVPQLFLKPSSSVIGPDEAIVLPLGAPRVDAEGEMVAVIGHTCRKVSADRALEYVFGYTCGNDVSARHWQRDDVQWWRAKGSDTFTAIGPFIVTGLDPANMELRTVVNGEEKQATNTSALVHSLADLISFASQVMTLEPGDLIFTGTPGVTPTLNDGDIVEVSIEGIGALRNPVVREA